MSIIGIVAEYNPFHKGHEYHIRSSREQLGPDSLVICAMSGDFVQRGDAALFDKFTRAEAACRCGADLVVELPVQWSLASAEGFASGAVGLLSAMGISHLSFGSELGDISAFCELAELLADDSIYEDIKNIQRKDASLSFASARQLAVEKCLGSEKAGILEKPNNILAVEYLKAVRRLAADIRAITVPRIGSGHDRYGDEGPKSASELRSIYYGGGDLLSYLPEAAAQLFAARLDEGRVLDRACFELAVMSRLHMLDRESFERLPDAADGLGARLYAAVKEGTDLEEICQAAKTKRYALSRVRRALMCAALGIESGAGSGQVPYARILAANERGCAYLRGLSESCALPLITKAAHIKKLPSFCADTFEQNSAAHDLFMLSNKNKMLKKGGQDWKNKPSIVKNQ